VRELENVIRSVSLFVDCDEIDARDLDEYTQLPDDEDVAEVVAAPPATPAPRAAAEPPRDPEDLSDLYDRAQQSGLGLRELKRRIEKELITRALAEAGGNITRAAEILRMKRPRLSQLLKEHGITTKGAGRPEEK
jgi:DNA-binding NtrC family response regulator